MTQVAITGAGGFLGQALVRQARAQGLEVLAITRRATHMTEDSGITQVTTDLGDASCVATLKPALAQADAVIHAAASFAGDAQTHARNTIAATDHLVQALGGQGALPKLVLISSLSVYDVAALSDGDLLTETSPILRTAAQRDAYAAAKVAQETCVQAYAGPQQILRPGAIYGPHRLWSAQLGFAKAGMVFCPGGEAAVPAVLVDHVAQAVLAAATTAGSGPVTNLIDPSPPRQLDWLAALGLRAIPVPRALVLAAGRALGRGPAWQARFRPLRYDTTAAQALWAPPTDHSFAAAVASARQQEETAS